MKKENKQKMEPGKTNKEDRLNFVKYWTDYMKKHSDKEWSTHQNNLINSLIKYEK